MGWESDGSTIGSVIVEVWEDPTRHVGPCKKAAELAKSTWKIPTRRTAESQAAARG
jgi:hypothetical protein